jgi:hypothetical protein
VTHHTAPLAVHIRRTGTAPFEKFRKDRLLLLVHVAVALSPVRMNTESLALNRVVELALALLRGRVLRPMVAVLRVVARGVARLD